MSDQQSLGDANPLGLGRVLSYPIYPSIEWGIQLNTLHRYITYLQLYASLPATTLLYFALTM